jgi:hypothetical protein
MKAEIQERPLREVAELGEEEARWRRAERLSRDPILGPFVRAKMADGRISEENSKVVEGGKEAETACRCR